MYKEEIKYFLGILLIITLFVITSYLVRNNIETLQKIIGNNIYGMILYVFILITATVIAPLNAMPFVPIASNLWGWFLAGILSIIGWGLGALIAFWLAREFGLPLVKKIIPIKKIEELEKRIPQKNIFWSIIFLRMSIPVDILSYALGLFSHIRFKIYALATFIGIAPFAFIFAYLGALPIIYQINAYLFGTLIFLIGVLTVSLLKAKKPVKNRKLF